MSCPDCGLEPLPDQRFCRACGSDLKVITKPLTESPAVFDLPNASALDSQPEDSRRYGLVQLAFAIMFIGLACSVGGKMLIHNDIITGVGVMIFVAGMFLTAMASILPPRRRKPGPNLSKQPEALTHARQVARLAQGRATEYVSSITEGTTDLLETPVANKARQKTHGDSIPPEH
jgi:hypothetical protein